MRLASWIVDNYDYPRGQDLMARAGMSGGGPLLVSVGSRLSETGSNGHLRLQIELSRFDTRLWSAALREALVQQSQDGRWDASGLRRIAWKIRVGVAIAADTLKDTTSSFALALQSVVVRGPEAGR